VPKARILIADDHALFAEAVKSLLLAEYDVVGISPNGRRLLSDAIALKPDLIVLDIGMPELNGIEAASQIATQLPETKLIFVTQQVDAQYLRAAFRAGGIGYVAKQSAASELHTAIQMALRGRVYITPLLRDVIQDHMISDLRKPGGMAPELTPRQREVLQMVAEGKTIKEISSALNISPKTVEFHKNALMNQTGLRTTADLVRYALQKGIISD